MFPDLRFSLMTAPTEHLAPTRRRTWMVPVALAAGATIVRLPMFFATRHVGFDESVYGASVIGMRHGQWPYKDLFSAMGPLHFVLLRAGDLLGFQTRFSPRVAPLLAGVGITLATYYVARRLTRGGLYAPAVAAALVATSGSLLWTAGTITGDGMANALAMAAVLAALEYRERPRTVMALLTGLAFGAALAVKP